MENAKIIGATESGKPIHMTYQPGLAGKDAHEASKHHEKKYQDHANMSNHWGKMGYKGLAQWHKGWASHHIKQSKKYSDDLSKSKSLEDTLKQKINQRG